MSDNWPPCIITVLDLIGTRSLASSGNGSSMMMQMHNFAFQKINHCLPNHDHGYIWNDSILLLSYQTKPEQKRRAVVDELIEFKRSLDNQCGTKTYAISVMGLAFPSDPTATPIFNGQTGQQPRAVILRTSSWAMANCFRIEEKLGHHKADWYIDSRITKGMNLPLPFVTEELSLLPSEESRAINLYRGYLNTKR